MGLVVVAGSKEVVLQSLQRDCQSVYAVHKESNDARPSKREVAALTIRLLLLTRVPTLLLDMRERSSSNLG